MPTTAPPLLLLVSFGAALVLAGIGGAREAADLAPDPGLDPNVAVEIRAAWPAQTLPGALRKFAADTPAPAVSRAIRAGLSAPPSAGLKLERLLAPFSYAVLSVERSCPPPALLACRPGVRFTGRLRRHAQRPLGSDLRAVLLAELGAAGFEMLYARRSHDGGGLAGRIGSRGETLARWRVEDGVLEVATGGLALTHAGALHASTPGIKTNPGALAALFGN